MGSIYIIVTVGSLKVHSQSIEIAIPDDAAYTVYTEYDSIKQKSYNFMHGYNKQDTSIR